MRTRAAALVLLLVASCGGAKKPALDSGVDPVDARVVDSAPGAQTAPDPRCTASGCLRSVAGVGDYTVSDLAPYLQPGVSIDNGYSIYTIEFVTGGRTSLATVGVPYAVAIPATGWHVVANNHGTVGIDDPCVVAGTIGGAGLAGTFAARGMIGVAVDYPGLGTPGVHPYLVADVEGRASLDALRAVKVFAVYERVPLSGKNAVVGLSQGGHATLAAAALHKTYAPELDIRGFSAAAPATMWEEQWRLGVAVDGPHVALHAMMIYAWADHYGWRGMQLWTPTTAAIIDDVMHSSCSYPRTKGGATVQTRLGSSADAIFSAPFLNAYETGQWGAFSPFHGYFSQNRIGPYTQTAPLKIYQGDADDTVLKPSTDALVDVLRAGGDSVDYEVVPGGTHTDVAYGFVAYQERRTSESIAWIKARLAE